MSDEQNNYTLAVDFQNKFWFYFLGLTFTILALSIQTSSLGKEMVSDVFEISSWILLLISGLAGLSRMEHMPKFYHFSGQKQNREKTINKIRMGPPAAKVTHAETGRMEPVTSFLKNQEEIIHIYDEEIAKIEKGGQIKYHLQRTMFVLGLMFLMVSRSYVVIQKWLK